MILAGDSTNVFQLNENTGEILLQQVLDFDTLAVTEYELEILATDAGLNSASTTVTVTVTDVSDEPPECSPEAYIVTVAEDESAGFAVSTWKLQAVMYKIRSDLRNNMTISGACVTNTILG